MRHISNGSQVPAELVRVFCIAQSPSSSVSRIVESLHWQNSEGTDQPPERWGKAISARLVTEISCRGRSRRKDTVDSVHKIAGDLTRDCGQRENRLETGRPAGNICPESSNLLHGAAKLGT